MVKWINIAGKEEQLPPEYAKLENAFTTAGDVMNDALDLLNTSDFHTKTSWKLDCKSEDISVHYKDFPDGRYFAGRCKLPLAAKDLMYHFKNDLEKDSEWNENIKYVKKLHQITNNVDCVTYCSNDVMIIKSREFVTARCFREYKNGYLLAGRSIDLKELPETSAAVRAYMHLGMGLATPDPDDPEYSCIYETVACMDMRGMLFKSAVNQIMGRLNLKDMEELRAHCKNVLRKELYPNL
ncbi:hypothetical protein PRIPAC_95216 [Pristionchus pacificus]|uniref:START domain-containing protein n=1 Tax=Pristionchus pacificus TaxID=54126 RepID=A0A2A6BJU5_PRIPA|nr:hypothetical protein PRIPAC_95216 [Pristionchus pacificus]|eukprot:PDM66096.1 hypothetical protein PRIPAC_45321 [Pristionchus pacificus]